MTKTVNARPRVVHITWSAAFGGIQRVLSDLVAAQVAAGTIRPAIVVGQGEGPFSAHYAATGAPVHYCGLNSGFDLNPAKYWRLYRALKDADLVHMHDFNPFIALTVLLARKRIVYFEHGNFGMGRKLKRSEMLNRRLLRAFLNHCVEVLCTNSRFTERVAMDMYSLGRVGKQVVPNGAAVGRAAIVGNDPLVESRLTGKTVVGTASRLAAVKRIDRLIEAFSLLRLQRDDVLLLIVGDGAERQPLGDLVAARNLDDTIVFTGYKQDVSYYQSLMDVCVIASQGEAFGLVAVEMLALGKPVIVFNDGGGLVEIIAGVEPDNIVGSVDDLAARLLFYCDHPEEAERGKQRRIAHAANFSIEAMERRMSDIYRQVVAASDGESYVRN